MSDRGPGLRGKSLPQLAAVGFAGYGSTPPLASTQPRACVRPTGLGIPICCRLAALMCGSIGLDDRCDGPGAVFTLSLPIADYRSPRGGGSGSGGSGSGSGSLRATSRPGSAPPSARTAPAGPGASDSAPRRALSVAAEEAAAAASAESGTALEVEYLGAPAAAAAAAGPRAPSDLEGAKTTAAAASVSASEPTPARALPASDSGARRYASMQHLLEAMPVARLETRTIDAAAAAAGHHHHASARGGGARVPKGGGGGAAAAAAAARSRDDSGVTVRMHGSAEPLATNATAGAGGRARPSAVVTSPGAADGPRPPRGLAGTRVLVVDDSPANLRFAVFVLKRLGCVVATCADGDEVLAAVGTAAAAGIPFDVVVTDLYMARMNGDGALASLRGAGHALPVLLCTANATSGDTTRFRSLGFAGQLGKPYWSDQMHAALVAAMAPVPASR